MIDYLNNTVWCKLAPSPIHGVGVFAIRDIPKGTKIHARGVNNVRPIRLTNFTGLHPEILKLIQQRWPLAVKGVTFQSPNDDARLLSFMNHCSNPNYDKVNDVTLIDIKAGEEITEDYGIDIDNVI